MECVTFNQLCIAVVISGLAGLVVGAISAFVGLNKGVREAMRENGYSLGGRCEKNR